MAAALPSNNQDFGTSRWQLTKRLHHFPLHAKAPEKVAGVMARASEPTLLGYGRFERDMLRVSLSADDRCAGRLFSCAAPA
jgi:hypothetical protein